MERLTTQRAQPPLDQLIIGTFPQTTDRIRRQKRNCQRTLAVPPAIIQSYSPGSVDMAHNLSSKPRSHLTRPSLQRFALTTCILQIHVFWSAASRRRCSLLVETNSVTFPSEQSNCLYQTHRYKTQCTSLFHCPCQCNPCAAISEVISSRSYNMASYLTSANVIHYGPLCSGLPLPHAFFARLCVDQQLVVAARNTKQCQVSDAKEHCKYQPRS